MFTRDGIVRMLSTLCGALAALGIAGCSTDPFRQGTEGALRERITTTSANPLFDEAPLEKINLVALIDPDSDKRTADSDKPLVDADFERALDRFYKQTADPESRRNRIVDRIMVASEQRCTVYKNYLKRVETYQGFITGLFTTILGAAGGISTVPNTSRFFSGLAGISSGVGAELKHDFFADTASLVIVPGIEQRREILERTIRGRFQEPIAGYTLEAALQDGARYHGACSLLAGLQQAGVSIRDVRNPGLLAVNETLRQLSVTKRLIDVPASALDPKDIVNQPLATVGAGVAGWAGIGGGSLLGYAGSAVRYWSQRQEASTAAIASVEARIAKLGGDSGLVAATKPELEKLSKAAAVKDATGKAQGCGTGWLRTRIKEEFNGALSGVTDKDKNIFAAQQKVQLAATAESAIRIREQAALEQAQEDAAGDVIKIKRYVQLIADAATNIGDRLGADAKNITTPIIYGVAKDIENIGQIQLGDGNIAKPAKTCP